MFRIQIRKHWLATRHTRNELGSYQHTALTGLREVWPKGCRMQAESPQRSEELEAGSRYYSRPKQPR